MCVTNYTISRHLTLGAIEHIVKFLACVHKANKAERNYEHKEEISRSKLVNNAQQLCISTLILHYN